MSRRGPTTTVLLAAVLVGGFACGAVERSSSARVPVPPPSEPDPVAHLLGVIPEGECWGLAAAPLVSTEHAVLEGRLRIRGPEHTSPEDLGWPRRESLLQVSNLALEENVVVPRATPLYVLAQETYMRRGPSLLADVRRIAAPTDHVFPLPTPGALQIVAVLPDEPRLGVSGRNLEPLTVYTSTRDGLVQRLRFVTHERVGPDSGCQRLALRMAATITDGGRTLPERRTVVLETLGPRGALLVDLPTGFFLATHTERESYTHAIFPGGRLRDQPLDAIAILRDADALPPAPDAERAAGSATPPAPVAGPIIPADLAWDDTGWGDRARLPWRRRGSVHLPGLGQVSVRLDLSQPATLEAMQSVVRSLRIGPPPPLPARPAGARLPSVSRDVEALAALEEVRRLAAARVVPLGQLAFGIGEMPEWTAFRALLARPEARDAFVHLAGAAPTTPARILGLAGLYLTDEPAFDAAYCALRPALDATVMTRSLCREELRETRTLLEADGAARGDATWSALQWESALARTAPDLRGGGLPYRLSHLDADRDSVLRAAVWLLSGDRAVPPTRGPGAPAWTPDPSSAGRVWLEEDGSLCAVERDGAALCWASGSVGVRHLPSFVRHPREIAWAQERGCAIDAEGRRVCFDYSPGARAVARERCGDGAAPPDGTPVVSVHDDGPWRHVVAHEGTFAGVTADGSLHGLALTHHRPAWARLASSGLGAAYPISVPGVVVAATPLDGGGLAFTEDGRLARWDEREPARVIHHVPGVVSVAVITHDISYAHLVDGRVLATAIRGGDARRFWSREGEPSAGWLEVPALRGARVVAARGRGCALYPDGRVRCWGALGEPADGAPRELAWLRGASSLSLTDFLLCGVMPGPRVRCAGEGLSYRFAGVREGDSGPRDASIRRALLPPRR